MLRGLIPVHTILNTDGTGYPRVVYSDGANMEEVPTPLAFSLISAVQASQGAVSRSGIYEAAKRGELHLRRRGKRTYVLADEFLNWLKDGPAVCPASDKAA